MLRALTTPVSSVAHRPARPVGPVLVACLLVLVLAGCGTSGGPRVASRPGQVQRGVASWYGGDFHGKPTASGEIYDMYAMTAAHPTLPLGTRVEVVNLDNGRRVTLRINDRGPFAKQRILDVSYAAAQELGMIGPGTARVVIRVLAPGRTAGREVKPEGKGPFTVQIGAFRDARRARQLRRELTPSYPMARVDSDGPWHRVRVGSFAHRSAAERLARELERLDYPALVVRQR